MNIQLQKFPYYFYSEGTRTEMLQGCNMSAISVSTIILLLLLVLLLLDLPTS